MRFTRRKLVPDRIERGAPLVQAWGIHVQFGTNRVLDGVSLNIHAGELVALVGPNGAGKSTLFNVIAGDLAPDSGTVELDGAELPSWTQPELALRRAVLPQRVTMAFPFLVDDVVRMGRAPWAGTPNADDDDEIVAEALAAADVGHLAHRQFTSLSGGEQARVALARVLAQRCQLLLLDEPTAALDIHHQELALATARARVDAGDGAVIVLHDLSVAAGYADRVAVLSHGRIVAEGAPADVLTADTLSEVYRHRVEVIRHPRTGEPIVLPVRGDEGAPRP